MYMYMYSCAVTSSLLYSARLLHVQAAAVVDVGRLEELQAGDGL